MGASSVSGKSNREYTPDLWTSSYHCADRSSCRYPAVWYTKEGQDLSVRLLDETMEELKLAGASLP